MSLRITLSLSLTVAAGLSVSTRVSAQDNAASAVIVSDDVRDFVEVHCLDCHDSDGPKGDLDLTLQPAGKVAQLWRWSRIRERVLAHEMPPASASEVEGEERTEFVEEIDALLAREVPRLALDPGQVTVRRLSRGQWRNTIRDVLGVEVDTSGLPGDDLGYGFDSIGDALTFSTLHLETYLAASRDVAEKVFHGEDPQNPPRRFFEAAAMHLVNDSGAHMGAAWQACIRTPRSSRRSTCRATASIACGSWRPVGRRGPSRPRCCPNSTASASTSSTCRTHARRSSSSKRPCAAVATRSPLSFINDYYDPKNPDRKQRDRNLRIDSLEIEGPVDAPVIQANQKWLHASTTGQSDASRLRRMIAAMLPRLWRRAVTTAELQRLQDAGLARLKAGDSFVGAQRFVLAAALASPLFLFRIEDRAPSAKAERLAGAELATRLSYFLWASAPDSDLLSLGREQQLRDPDVLLAQVDRMLRDRRAEALATEFAAQWFELRALQDRTPDPDRFAGFDDELRAAMARESELLFLAVLRKAATCA